MTCIPFQLPNNPDRIASWLNVGDVIHRGAGGAGGRGVKMYTLVSPKHAQKAYRMHL